MAEKKYYWLKLKNDFFASKQMKKLRKIAGGDTFTIIYLKLQLLSLKDGGKLFFEGVEDDFSEELALAIDEDADNVQATLLFLQKCGLLEIVSDDEIILTEVPNLIGSETSTASRMRRLRERSTVERNNVTVERNNVQKCYTEIEIDKDKELETEIETEKREKINYQKIVEMYNNTCVSFPRIRVLSDSRKKAIKARLSSGYTLSDLEELFRKAEASDFLKGSNSRNWSATFDWLIADKNIAKVLDGNYDNRGHGSKNTVPAADDDDDDFFPTIVTSNIPAGR